MLLTGMKRNWRALVRDFLRISIKCCLESKRLAGNFRMCIAMPVALFCAGFLMASSSRYMRIERLLLQLPICAEKRVVGKDAFEV